MHLFTKSFIYIIDFFRSINNERGKRHRLSTNRKHPQLHKQSHHNKTLTILSLNHDKVIWKQVQIWHQCSKNKVIYVFTLFYRMWYILQKHFQLNDCSSDYCNRKEAEKDRLIFKLSCFRCCRKQDSVQSRYLKNLKLAFT